jgi:hypothetical protein
VLFAASGTLPAAAIVRDQSAVIEHKLYWAAVDSEAEGYYLIAVLNSETARGLTEHLQSRGQWGARDFDKVVLSLPIPRYDPAVALHGELSAAAAHAEQVAASVPLGEGTRFVRARGVIRHALREDGVAARIDALVARLLEA